MNVIYEWVTCESEPMELSGVFQLCELWYVLPYGIRGSFEVLSAVLFTLFNAS